MSGSEDLEEMLAANDPMSTPVMTLEAAPLGSMATYAPSHPQTQPDAAAMQIFGGAGSAGDMATIRDAPTAGPRPPRAMQGTQQAFSRLAADEEEEEKGDSDGGRRGANVEEAMQSRRRKRSAKKADGSVLSRMLDSLTEDARQQQLVLLFCVATLVLIPHSQRVLHRALPFLQHSTTATMVLNAVLIAATYYYLVQML